MLWRLEKAGKERLARRSEGNRQDLSNSFIFPTKEVSLFWKTLRN